MSASKNDYIKYKILKSNEIYEDARLLATNQRWNSCMNRLYYSSFYLVSAMLYRNDIKAGTHNGVKTQFNIHYIKTGILDIKFGKLYSNLFGWRQESDYADFIDFDKETVFPLIEQVAELNKVLSDMILKTLN